MKIFITGVSGFIGTGLVDYLQQTAGISLFGHSQNAESTKLKFKDHKIEIISHYSAAVFDNLGIDCVIHLAGIAHDLSNKYRPQDYYTVNFEGTKSVFEAFIKSNAKKIIFLSSIKACVDSSDEPVDEETPANPVSDYGKSKRMAEAFMEQQALSEGKNVYILRPCMIYGKGNKGNLNSLYRYVKSGLPYLFGAYSNRRSFLSADNLNFILREFLENVHPSGIYHLADEGPLSTNELVALIASSLGRKPRIWNIPVSLIEPLSRLGSFLKLPSDRLKQKLTENLVVSTVKLKHVLRKPLPVDTKAGLLTTLRSFDE